MPARPASWRVTRDRYSRFTREIKAAAEAGRPAPPAPQPPPTTEEMVTQLRERIAKTERTAETMARANAAWRKGGAAGLRAAGFGEKFTEACARTMEESPWLDRPFEVGRYRAAVRRDKARLAEIENKVAAVAADGGAE